MPVRLVVGPATSLLDIAPAVEVIQRGGLLVFPTDTVYGIGCDAFNPAAVRELARVKRRPADKPFPVLVPTPEEVELVALEINDDARALMHSFWPGPLTLILPRRPELPAITVGDADSVGVRQPNDRIAVALMKLSGRLLTGPSANPGGAAPATSAGELAWEIVAATDCVLAAGPRDAQPSTVLDLTGTPYRVLRAGAVSVEQLRACVSAAIAE